MATLDAEIDRLYQLPLAEFTAARNELAKRAGDRREAVKTLQKPNTAAWAVNQLYWNSPQTFKRLTSAAERLRVAHARNLTGGKADVASIERIHAEALHAAVYEVRSLLEAAGENPSVAVMNDVRDTLQALPSDDAPGRLTRPLAPMGFAALLKMLPGDGASPGRPSLVEARKLAAPAERRPDRARASGNASAEERRQARQQAERAAREAREAEAESRRRRKDLERQIREARAAEREKDAALTKARDELARAEREERHRQKALEEQKFEVRRLAAEVASHEEQARTAGEKRHALETALREL